MWNEKKIFIDFEGVLNTYKGWQGNDELYSPMPETEDFLKELNSKFEVFVFTTRSREKVWKWLIKHFLDSYIVDVTNKKEPAHLYIDDRAIQFNGDYSILMQQIKSFKTHWTK